MGGYFNLGAQLQCLGGADKCNYGESQAKVLEVYTRQQHDFGVFKKYNQTGAKGKKE